MEFHSLTKHFGSKWIEEQIATMSSIFVPDNLRFKFMEKIEELVQKLEIIPGFNKWVNDARSGDFEDFFFELMIFENLYKKADYMEIKPENYGKTPEALIEKGEKFYIEAKKLNGIPNNTNTKLNTLIKDARQKFKLSRGILFIGCFGLFSYENGEPKPSKEFRDLVEEATRKLNSDRENTRIVAVVLTNIYVQTDMEKLSIQKRYNLLRRPEHKKGFNENKFKELFDVDGWVEEDSPGEVQLR